MSGSRGRFSQLVARTASRAFWRGHEHCSIWKSTLGPQFARCYGTDATINDVVRKKGSQMKWFLASTVVGGGAAAAIALQDETSPFSRNVEGIRRAAIFWVAVLPIFTHYKYTQWRVKGEPDDVQDAAYNRLHERYAPVVEAISLRLKGFYLKNAQIMSTRDDFVPPAYLTLCKKFQDSVPTELSDAQVKAIVERELGCPISDVFSHFDFTPLGAASIGQVHRATLKEELTGEARGRLVFGESRPRDVVVKVMYPNIEERFRGDLRVLVNFCQLAMPQHTQTMREIEKHFSSEMNYQVEAQNLCDVRSNLYRAGWASRVEVPEPVLPLCTRHILVMQYLPGVKLVDGVRERWRQVAEARGLSMAELEEDHKRQIKEGKIQRRSASVASMEGSLQKWALRTKDLAANALRLGWNWSLPRVLLQMPQLEYRWTPVPINLGAVLELLLHVHAHEIFVDGVFNGDPHPGNILLMPDGRLGLIDYGQVKHISLEARRRLAQLMIALAKDGHSGENRAEVARIYKDVIGVRFKYNKEDILWRHAAFYFDRDTDNVTLGMNVHDFTEWMQAQDPLVSAVDDYVLAGRVSVMMRGMGNAFDLKLKVSDYWRAHAEAFLKAHGPPVLD